MASTEIELSIVMPCLNEVEITEAGIIPSSLRKDFFVSRNPQ